MSQPLSYSFILELPFVPPGCCLLLLWFIAWMECPVHQDIAISLGFEVPLFPLLSTDCGRKYCINLQYNNIRAVPLSIDQEDV